MAISRDAAEAARRQMTRNVAKTGSAGYVNAEEAPKRIHDLNAAAQASLAKSSPPMSEGQAAALGEGTAQAAATNESNINALSSIFQDTNAARGATENKRYDTMGTYTDAQNFSLDEYRTALADADAKRRAAAWASRASDSELEYWETEWDADDAADEPAFSDSYLGNSSRNPDSGPEKFPTPNAAPNWKDLISDSTRATLETGSIMTSEVGMIDAMMEQNLGSMTWTTAIEQAHRTLTRELNFAGDDLNAIMDMLFTRWAVAYRHPGADPSGRVVDQELRRETAVQATTTEPSYPLGEPKDRIYEEQPRPYPNFDPFPAYDGTP
jgi:hypothetical protein|tara:strand:+ start:47 stop:1021 length:975 start_codon:yes stop_codon:yes gene_type:complete